MVNRSSSANSTLYYDPVFHWTASSLSKGPTASASRPGLRLWLRLGPVSGGPRGGLSLSDTARFQACRVVCLNGPADVRKLQDRDVFISFAMCMFALLDLISVIQSRSSEQHGGEYYIWNLSEVYMYYRRVFFPDRRFCRGSAWLAPDRPSRSEWFAKQ